LAFVGTAAAGLLGIVGIAAAIRVPVAASNLGRALESEPAEV
jgi:hypothetical protein